MIENVQRRASKTIPSLSHLSYQHRLEALELTTLQCRRYRGDMIENRLDRLWERDGVMHRYRRPHTNIKTQYKIHAYRRKLEPGTSIEAESLHPEYLYYIILYIIYIITTSDQRKEKISLRPDGRQQE